MSRCSSAKAFGGSGMPSGVCTVARRSAALRRVGLKLRMPSRAKVAFIRFTRRVRSRLIPPAMQHGKQPFWAWLQLLARLTLNTRNYAANQPARLAQLDDGNDRAILVQGDEGPAQVVRLGHRGTPSLNAATKLPCP